MFSRLLLLFCCFSSALCAAPRQLETLQRGVVVTPVSETAVLVSWRLLASDPDDIAFHVTRRAADGTSTLLTKQPLATATCYLDQQVDRTQAWTYMIEPVKPGPVVGQAVLSPQTKAYWSIPLQTPRSYSPNDASVGDLDGDGEYEIVLHQAGRGKDNSQPGETDPPILEAYRLDGKLLWQIKLGRNIREGAHYTQFIVYDLDGDGRAEVACKTADGTIDGIGKAIGNATADHRNAQGYILSGPEFLTIFDGRTGAAKISVPFVPERGKITSWGDNYGNRCDRFLAAVAYLDGMRPSLIMCRGYYARTVVVAWDYREGKLSQRWLFDSDAGDRANRSYRGQGDHWVSVADVDADGRDEIVYGACCIDDNGRGLYSTGLGHGDALHVGDLDSVRPGLEVFNIHEKVKHEHGANMRDARTGKILWSKKSPDVGRGVAFDIDPRHPGAECWAAGTGLSGLWNAQGKEISAKRPRSCNFGVWWDGDDQRELLSGISITKWNWQQEREVELLRATDCAAINGSKSTPCLAADFWGDWREEVLWRSSDGKELRLYSTPHPTTKRRVTLMHDTQYRVQIAGQNVGYNQPAHPSFWGGEKAVGK